MLIAGASDLHGHLSHSIPECDVLCIVGDIVPLISSAEDWKPFQELQWMERKFVRWLKRQPFDRCFVSWGNHDIVAAAPETRGEVTDLLECVEGVTVLDANVPHERYGDVLFSAFPYTPTIQQRNWAFSLPRGDVRNELAVDMHIHEDADVVLSHGPPMGFLDKVDGRNEGCAALVSKLIDVAPKLVMCGHIHEERGNRASMWNRTGKQTRLINVSVCDRNYSPRGGKIQTYEVK